MTINNPNLGLTNAQYSPWRASAEAIAGSSYIFDPANVGNTPYRPKQWNEELLFFLTASVYDLNTKEYSTRYYYFDGVLKTEHVNQRRITQHPVQVGANITDHSFQLPARLTMEIGVSDAMDCYSLSNDWTSETVGRSINAFQGLKKLQESGKSLSVTTRLFTYDNMVIESISVPEDYRTLYTLRASIIFQQIITVQISSTKISTMPHTVKQTFKGPQQKITVSGNNSGNSPLTNLLGNFGL
jgi:hypothetical protein